MSSAEDLRTRAQRLRLTQKQIAERADLDKATVWRALTNSGNCLVSTLTAIEAVIVAEEKTLRAALSEPAR